MTIRFIIPIIFFGLLLFGCQLVVPDLTLSNDTSTDSESGTETDAPETPREQCVESGGYWYDENDVFADTIEAFEALVPTCHDTPSVNCTGQSLLRFAYRADGTFLTAAPTAVYLANEDEVTGEQTSLATHFFSTVRCMPNLSEINMPGNRIVRVDISNNPLLTFVNFYNNNVLEDIYMPRMRYVTEIHLNNNAIAQIDLSGAEALRVIYLENNLLTNLNIGHLSNLTNLYINGNFISSEIDLYGNNNLVDIHVAGNPIASLILPENPAYVQDVTAHSTFLSSLNLSGCVRLQYLDINNTQIDTIDVNDAGAALESLSAYNTPITSLNLTQNSSLSELTLADSNIAEITFPTIARIIYLDLSYTNLIYSNADTAIALQPLTQLEILNLYGNSLLSLTDAAAYFPPEFWNNPSGVLLIEETKWIEYEGKPTDWGYNSTDGYAYHL